MIVRISEARVRAGLLDEFRDFIVDGTRDFADLDGFLGAEILVSSEASELAYISRWRDEAAVAAFAGPNWRTKSVMLPEQERFLVEPLRLRHFATIEPPRR